MFKRSGSVVRYHVEGSMPAPSDASFVEALGNRRFRSIETAASEEVSYGWVTPADPSGNSFELEDLDHDAGIWLRMRLDKKKLPAVWLQIHRAASERAAGRPLSVREKRELRDELHQKLLPKVLPSVTLVEAVWFPKRRVVLLFSTSKAIKEVFDKLFRESFDVTLEETEPGELAQILDLPREQKSYLEEVRPIQWPRMTDPGTAAASGHGDDMRDAYGVEDHSDRGAPEVRGAPAEPTDPGHDADRDAPEDHGEEISAPQHAGGGAS